jgi:calcineurin-like phosphoesterase family protein
MTCDIEFSAGWRQGLVSYYQPRPENTMLMTPNIRPNSNTHYNSWQLYGHSHGKLPPIGKQWDIGVDNNDFSPVSFNEIREIMQNRPDNPNFVRKKDV